jgi:uncharacterized protein YeaO (DUF488 family)
VERLWPRGLTKARAALDLWLKDLAPSPELRKWFGHDPAKWKRFEQRYWKELQTCSQAVDLLRRKMNRGTVTLVYAAHDEEHNGAVALKAFLEHRRGSDSVTKMRSQKAVHRCTISGRAASSGRKWQRCPTPNPS